MKKKNKQLDWFFGALRYFSSLVVVLLVGGRENAARCSVATSAVCIMTLGDAERIFISAAVCQLHLQTLPA